MIPTSKHELRFHGDGSFRILMISDIHSTMTAGRLSECD